MYVVLMHGSPAANSCVATLLDNIARRLEKAGATVQLLQLQAMQPPVNDPHYRANPHKHPQALIRHLVDTIARADAVVLGTPLYHGSFSGLLKTALDNLAEDAFANKAIGLVSNASDPFGAITAAQALVPVARSMKGEVINRLVGTSQADFVQEGDKLRLRTRPVHERLDLFVAELLQRVTLLQG